MIDTTKAVDACRQLVIAYRNGKDRGDHIDWNDVDLSFGTACAALGVDQDEPSEMERIELDRIGTAPLMRILGVQQGV